MTKVIVVSPHDHEGPGTSGTRFKWVKSRRKSHRYQPKYLSLGNKDRDDPRIIADRPLFTWGKILQYFPGENPTMAIAGCRQSPCNIVGKLCITTPYNSMRHGPDEGQVRSHDAVVDRKEGTFVLQTSDPAKLPLPNFNFLMMQFKLNRVVSCSAAADMDTLGNMMTEAPAVSRLEQIAPLTN